MRNGQQVETAELLADHKPAWAKPVKYLGIGLVLITALIYQIEPDQPV